MRLGTLVATSLLAACDVAVDVAPVDVVPSPALPPPGLGGLDLEVDGVLRPGETLTFRVAGLRPGQKAWVVAGEARENGAYCPPMFGGLCADVRDPVVIGQARADAWGVATVTRVVPVLPSDRWSFQALTARPYAATSDVVGRYRLRRGTFRPVTFQRMRLADGVLTGDVLEGGAWADTANYQDHPWACYVSTRLELAPTPAASTCPGCEYTWEVALPDPFEETEIEGECASYFGFGEDFFDDRFRPRTLPSGTAVNGGWARLAGGAEWGLDLDYFDAAYGTIYPVAVVYEPTVASWWTLGPIGRITHPTYDEIIVGVGYGGSFTY